MVISESSARSQSALAEGVVVFIWKAIIDILSTIISQTNPNNLKVRGWEARKVTDE